MALSNVYSLKTLNDNWFEDRLQPEDGLTSVGSLDSKKARAHETEIAHVGDRLDVLARIARMPPRRSFAQPDDGFNEKKLTSREDFRDPKTCQEYVTSPLPTPTFIVGKTILEVCNEARRPLPGNQRGFGAVLPRHEEGHGQGFWRTTTGDTYRHGRSLSEAPTPTTGTKTEPSSLRGAGVTTLMMENRINGLRVGTLCGEAFRESGNPGMDTRTQRAWLYSPDPSLKFIEYGGQRPKLAPKDNELSVQIGDGEMTQIRAALANRGGFLSRNSTKITKGNEKRSGISIYQDD